MSAEFVLEQSNTQKGEATEKMGHTQPDKMDSVVWTTGWMKNGKSRGWEPESSPTRILLVPLPLLLPSHTSKVFAEPGPHLHACNSCG